MSNATVTSVATTSNAATINQDSDDVFADLASIFTRGKLEMDAHKREMDYQDQVNVQIKLAAMQFTMDRISTEMTARAARAHR